MSNSSKHDLHPLVASTIADRKAQAAAWMAAHRKKPLHTSGAIIYHANGDVSNLGISAVEVFSYERLREIVGGSIEQFRLSDGRWLTINEDGLGLNLPFNAAATALYMEGRSEFSGIHGDVLVCSAKQAGADE